METEYLLHGPNWQLNYKLNIFFFPRRYTCYDPINISIRLTPTVLQSTSPIDVNLFEDFQLKTDWA